jgi:hypothetical protein
VKQFPNASANAIAECSDFAKTSLQTQFSGTREEPAMLPAFFRPGLWGNIQFDESRTMKQEDATHINESYFAAKAERFNAAFESAPLAPIDPQCFGRLRCLAECLEQIEHHAGSKAVPE